jgi:phosphoribosylglycinamide formyltransferase-1
MQSVVPVLPGDDEHQLAARVLATEHVIYPLAVRWFVEGKLRVANGLVIQADGASQVLM